MAVMIVQADGARYMLDQDVETARNAVKTVADTGREALEEMRRLGGGLRDPAPVGSGSTAAAPDGSAIDGMGGSTAGLGGSPARGGSGPAGTVVRAGVDAAVAPDLATDPGRRRLAIGELDTLLDRSRRAGLVVRYTVHGTPLSLPAGVELTLYRVVQEALTNVLKHAGAGANTEVVLDYTGPDAVVVRVVDDGRGRASAGPSLSGGHGLVGMRERVMVYSGSLQVGARLAGGWQVEARLPLRSLRPVTEGAA